MAAGGYPGEYEKGLAISGLDQAQAIDGVTVFHAGTSERDGRIVTNGGRVLGVTGLGSTVAEAIETTYRGVRAISWEKVHYRTDIGSKAVTAR
jgi:phosphoribosylamine--glycine ligase